jgi:hypothetical protein
VRRRRGKFLRAREEPKHQRSSQRGSPLAVNPAATAVACHGLRHRQEYSSTYTGRVAPNQCRVEPCVVFVERAKPEHQKRRLSQSSNYLRRESFLAFSLYKVAPGLWSQRRSSALFYCILLSIPVLQYHTVRRQEDEDCRRRTATRRTSCRSSSKRAGVSTRPACKPSPGSCRWRPRARGRGHGCTYAEGWTTRHGRAALRGTSRAVALQQGYMLVQIAEEIA